MLNRQDIHDLETLLHAVLNCGKETTQNLIENNTEFDGNIIDEIERLYVIIKDNNEKCEEVIWE